MHSISSINEQEAQLSVGTAQLAIGSGSWKKQKLTDVQFQFRVLVRFQWDARIVSFPEATKVAVILDQAWSVPKKSKCVACIAVQLLPADRDGS